MCARRTPNFLRSDRLAYYCAQKYPIEPLSGRKSVAKSGERQVDRSDRSGPAKAARRRRYRDQSRRSLRPIISPGYRTIWSIGPSIPIWTSCCFRWSSCCRVRTGKSWRSAATSTRRAAGGCAPSCPTALRSVPQSGDAFERILTDADLLISSPGSTTLLQAMSIDLPTILLPSRKPEPDSQCAALFEAGARTSWNGRSA